MPTSQSSSYSRSEADRLFVHNDTPEYLLSQAYDKNKDATYNYVNGIKKNHVPVVDYDNLIYWDMINYDNGIRGTTRKYSWDSRRTMSYTAKQPCFAIVYTNGYGDDFALYFYVSLNGHALSGDKFYYITLYLNAGDTVSFERRDSTNDVGDGYHWNYGHPYDGGRSWASINVYGIK